MGETISFSHETLNNNSTSLSFSSDLILFSTTTTTTTTVTLAVASRVLSPTRKSHFSSPYSTAVVSWTVWDPSGFGVVVVVTTVVDPSGLVVFSRTTRDVPGPAVPVVA